MEGQQGGFGGQRGGGQQDDLLHMTILGEGQHGVGH